MADKKDESKKPDSGSPEGAPSSDADSSATDAGHDARRVAKKGPPPDARRSGASTGGSRVATKGAPGDSATAAMAAAVGARAAQLSKLHPLTIHLEKMVSAPPSSRIAMAIGELATAMDHAAQGRSFAIAISAIRAGHKMGLTSLSLAAIWGRWGVRTCLIELGSTKASLGGALTATDPDLATACDMAMEDNGPVEPIALHPRVPMTTVIRAASADVMGLLSTGRLPKLIQNLKQTHDRIVIAAPALETGFPFLSLNDACDRLVLSCLAGKTNGAPLREIAEQAMVLGMRPIEVVWHEK